MNEESNDETRRSQARDANLDDAQRADLYYRLAERAQNRLEVRTSLNWKVSIALWSAFGGGAGIVLAASAWAPTLWEPVAGTLIALVVVLTYRFWWVPHIRKESERDMVTSHFWEGRIVEIIDLPLPEGLEPDCHPSAKAVKWVGTYRGKPYQPGLEQWQPSQKLHTMHHAQIGVTILFALLFGGALFSKWYYQQLDASPPRMTREGSLEVDSASKVKIGK